MAGVLIILLKDSIVVMDLGQERETLVDWKGNKTVKLHMLKVGMEACDLKALDILAREWMPEKNFSSLAESSALEDK